MSEKINPITIISGGTGGIGRVIARVLAQQGHRIVLLSYAQDGDEVLKTLSGSQHSVYQCDLTDAAAVRATIQKVRDIYGRIDHCVHAAVSPLVRKKASVMTSEEFRQQFEVTTFGGFNLFSSVIPFMKEQQYGRIVGITSVAIEQNVPAGSMAGYVAAKFALRGLLRELATELRLHGVTVNAVAPDFIPTLLHKDIPERALEIMREKKTNGEFIRAEDVAHAVAFLLSPESGTVNGISLPVSGGDGMTL